MMEQNLIELLTDRLFSMLPLTAKISQHGRSIVQNGIFPDVSFDLMLQFVQIRQFRIPGSNPGAVSLYPLQISAKPLNRRTEACDKSQLRRQKHSSLCCLDQSVFRSFRICKRRSPFVFHHAACGCSFFHAGPAKPFVKNRFRFGKFLTRGL